MLSNRESAKEAKMRNDLESSLGYSFDELSKRVIGAAIQVHRRLGPGFLESVYEQALKLELSKRKIPFESQKKIDVSYEGVIVGVHVLDMFVDQSLVVELKAVSALEDVHFAQVSSYLRAANAKVGLLLNFNSPFLVVRRVVNGFQNFALSLFSRFRDERTLALCKIRYNKKQENCSNPAR